MFAKLYKTQQIKDYDQGHYNKDSEFLKYNFQIAKVIPNYILFHKRKDKNIGELIRGAILVSD